MTALLPLSGKIALITGGAVGIGGACSLHLARAGAEVIVTFNKSAAAADTLRAEFQHQGLEADFVQADLSKHESVDHLFEFIRTKKGRLDILVNNAGIKKDNLLLNVELAEWDRIHQVNLRGAFLCTKAAVDLMFPRGSGKIINIASVLAIAGGKGSSAYAAAKGGLVSFTRACAAELGRKGIQVNAVLPGLIVTQMTSHIRKQAGDALLERIPLGRYGQPEDVAHLVEFLASVKADYITGQLFVVDGGLSIA